MSVKSPEAPAQGAPGGIRGIETRSIDWVPESERHGKLWHQAPLWFLGNFQYFSGRSTPRRARRSACRR